MVEGLVKLIVAFVQNRKGESKMAGNEYGKNTLWNRLSNFGFWTSIFLILIVVMCLVFVLIK